MSQLGYAGPFARDANWAISGAGASRRAINWGLIFAISLNYAAWLGLAVLVIRSL